MHDRNHSPLVHWRLKYREKYDAVSMAIYVLLVYAWGFYIGPLGHDFAVLANAGQELPAVTRHLFAWEMQAFGGWPVGYHVVNLALMYGCMLCLHFLVNASIKGPFWLGTLAAVLFMANPATGGAVLHLSGVADLAPCLAALAALMVYALNALRPTRLKYALALALFAFASLAFSKSALLVIPVVLYERLVVPRERRHYARLLPFIVVGIPAMILHGSHLLQAASSLQATFVPLYFLFYPIGFLPETVQRLHQAPWLGWISAAAVLAILALVVRKTRRGAVLFGLLAMLAFRLGGQDRPVDLVHLVGGGQLLVPSAMYHLGLVALFHRMMEHPRWRFTIVGGTTIMCMVYFAMQIHQDFAWRHASRCVHEFQSRAEAAATQSGDEPLGVCPDYRYYQGAPMCLSESIAYDSPFSNRIPAVPLLPLHYFKPDAMEVSVDTWSPESGTVSVRGKRPLDVVCAPYTLAHEGKPWDSEHTAVVLSAVDAEEFRFTITSREASLPTVILPGAQGKASSGEEAGRDAE